MYRYLLAICLAVLLSVTFKAAYGGGFPDKMPEPDNRAFSCFPDVLSEHSRLRLRLPSQHSAELAVVDPTGSFYFISYPTGEGYGGVKPIISSKDFAEMRNFKMNVGTAKGVVWSQGEAITRIFASDGRYEILLGNSLDSGAPDLEGYCVVTFRRQFK